MPKSSDSLQHKQTDGGSENQTAGKGLAELPFCIVLTQGHTRKSKVSCYTRRVVIKLLKYGNYVALIFPNAKIICQFMN